MLRNMVITVKKINTNMFKMERERGVCVCVCVFVCALYVVTVVGA